MNTPPPAGDESDIAIIGMACRVPGADDLAQFWRNLCDGVESVSFFSDEELQAAGVDPAQIENPDYVKAAGILSDVAGFDAAFFDVSASEAELLDPQQRLFLECAWQALEQAGCDPDRYAGAIGCFAGVGLNSYLLNNLHPLLKEKNPAMAYQILIANDKDFLATRVAYKLNLRGPCMTVQTACSTSLVAVHLGVQALLNGECDLALAGGVTVRVPQRQGYVFQEGLIFSPDGHCRAFDADARGMVGGSGVGTVVLKRYSEALADGDRIHAVIKGSAVNNDGTRKAGFTAPGVDGQAAVIAEAQAVAGVDPATIGYIEAHGTGTALGDPIEVTALTQAFRAHTDETGFCALGSVKSNFGHLDAAAGIASLIKTALALEHGRIPPSLHFRQANPQIDFAASPFFVNAALRNWAEPLRRAGVSSFGIGGANAHIVLEQPPSLPPSELSRRPAHWVILSARSASALDAAGARLADHLAANPGIDPADLAYTLGKGRKTFRYRRALLASGADDIVDRLRRGQGVLSESSEPGARPVAFLFPGQGAQYPGMSAGLYRQEPTFRQGLDRCAETLQPLLALDIRRLLNAEDADRETAAQRLRETALAQPALFAVEYALAQLWLEWGVEPQAMLGHSIGEYVAACLAGVFSLDDALHLVAERGRLMQSLPGGSMLAVPLGEAELIPLLEADLDLAAVNATAQCVVSGSPAAIERLRGRLTADGVECAALVTSHAFHSAAMDPILDAFQDRVAATARHTPKRPFISNVTGDWITSEQAADPAYWTRHLRQPVRFAQGLGRLLEEPERILLEVGPGRTLATLAQRHPARQIGHAVLNTSGKRRDAADDQPPLLDTLGRLWLAGVLVDWAAVYRHEKRRIVPLPGYPFEHKRYWIEARPDAVRPSSDGDRRKPLDEWFYTATWKRSRPAEATPAVAEAGRWLAFVDAAGLVERLAPDAGDTIRIYPGAAFGQCAANAYTLNPTRREDYRTLAQALEERHWSPDTVLYGWSFGGDETAVPGNRSFQALLYLVQALRPLVRDVLRLRVISDGLHDITGQETLYPEKAVLLGLLKVIAQEQPLIHCRCIDLAADECAAADARWLSPLRADCRQIEGPRVVAYRGRYRWEPGFEPLSLPARPVDTGLRERGVYLIAGGWGALGYALARHLAATVRARLALVGRRSVPAEADWPAWLAEHGEDDPVSRCIRRWRALRELGAEVLSVTADVAEPMQMATALRQAEDRFGIVHGVIHAAGGKAFAALEDLDEAECEWQLRPKIQGLHALERALGDRPLDFCLVMSSLSSTLGALGLAAYVAAHTAMEVFVQRHNRRHPIPWRLVAWDNWLADGANASHDPAYLTPSEGVQALARLLGRPSEEPVLVSTTDLFARLERWVELDLNGSPAEPAAPLHERPSLASAYQAPTTEWERRLADLWRPLFGVREIGIQDNFFELGGDSLSGLQLIAKAGQQGIKLSLKDLFEHQTIAQLAQALSVRAPAPARVDPPATGDVPLTPIQHWFFERDFAEPRHFNQFLVLNVAPAVSPAILEEALASLMRRHDALRLRFRPEGGGWRQYYAEPDATFSLTVIDLAESGATDRARIRQDAARRLQTGLNLQTGPICGAILFRYEPGEPARLLWVCHHLAVDFTSWRILAQDLEMACQQRLRGEAIALPARTDSYQRWSRHLQAWAASPAASQHLDDWLGSAPPPVQPLPKDFPSGENTFGTVETVAVALEAADTAALLQKTTGPQDALLAVLADVLGTASQSGAVAIDVEGHGRTALGDGPADADLDVSRTVGWFTAIHPAFLERDGAADRTESQPPVRHSLHGLAEAGSRFGALRYLGPKAAIHGLSALPAAETLLLFMGRIDEPALESSLLSPVAAEGGLDASPYNRRPYLLEINSFLTAGRLWLEWNYSSACHRRGTVTAWADDCLDRLRAFSAQNAGRYRASDFPEAELSQDELDELIATLGKPNE